MPVKALLAAGCCVVGLTAIPVSGTSGLIRPSPPAAKTGETVRPSEWQAVIEDWFVDGVFDGVHRCAAIREAAKRLPSLVPVYSAIFEDTRSLERRTCR